MSDQRQNPSFSVQAFQALYYKILIILDPGRAEGPCRELFTHYPYFSLLFACFRYNLYSFKHLAILPVSYNQALYKDGTIAFSLGEIDNLMDDEKIVAEPVLSHDRQFVLQSLEHLPTDRPVLPGQSPMTQPGQLPGTGRALSKLDPGQNGLAGQ